MNDVQELRECIACGGSHLMPLLDLGDQPLANSLLKNPDDVEDVFPLGTNYCSDCFHVQLTHKVNPDRLFKNYVYMSGVSNTFKEFCDWFAKYVTETTPWKEPSVLDIGCNDGTQLDSFKELDWFTCGVDPAENLYEISSKKHNIHCGYFGEGKSNIDYLKFDAIICQNAFAHNYDQLELLKNMKSQLDTAGKIYITTSQADMIKNNEFDTIYHEHLSFYCVRSMNALAKRAGLNIIEVVKHPIHGNSFIFVLSEAQKREAYVDLLMKQEEEAGLYDPSTYITYRYNCEMYIKNFRRFMNTLSEYSFENLIVGYGAPAKGNTLLNAAKINLDFIVDDTPLKQGLYTPGMRISIASSDSLKHFEDEREIIFVPLAWNFYDEIKAKILALRPNHRDRFIRIHPIMEEEEA